MQKLVYAVGSVVAALIVVGLFLPRVVRVEVSRDIDAPAATVFALLNDFHRVRLWSPLADTDPNARIMYSGPVRGTGATMTWDGAVIGTGTQIITDSKPFQRVETVINPGTGGEARSSFDLVQSGDTTVVTWGYETDHAYNIVARYLALFLRNVVRRGNASGLDALKDLAESLPRTDFSDIELEHLTVESTEIAYLPTTSRPDPAAISEAMGEAYYRILSFIDQYDLREAGAPISVMRSFSGAELQFDAAIPVAGIGAQTPRNSGSVKLGQTYSGPVIRVRHIGSYRNLAETHRKIAAYIAALGLRRQGSPWESYVSDPTRVPEAELLTYIYYPVRPEPDTQVAN